MLSFALSSPSALPVPRLLSAFPLRRAAAFSLLLVAALAFFSSDAQAALRAKGAAATLEEATNPQPAGDDILLPMPCGAAMAFKTVGVQAEGFLWDMQTQFGCDNCDRQERDYYERRYSATISGPFAQKDLPIEWHKKLSKPEVGEYYYFLIGKYEISNFQWKAVMEGWCPGPESPLGPEDALPKTEVSWFDAMNFARAYTEWLLANHPESLPRFANDGKNVGYLRLPTEAEWEYAARGGQKVPRAEIREQEFFSMPEGASYEQYAVFRPEGASRIEEKPAAIGSRKPNPLGVYDMAGNVAEMVLDTFHFSLGGRLHGSAGGYVRKGGGYLSGLSEIMPGRREEVAFFQSQGPTVSRDMGARMVLSGINTPGGDRPAQLEKEWETAGEGSGLLLDQGKNPLEELDRLIAATSNTTEKQNLERLRSIIKDNNIALERQNEAAAESLIRSSLFMIETVRNYGVRHKSLVNMIDNSKREREAAKSMSQDIRDAVEKTITDLESNRAGMERSLDAAIGFYRSKVEESLAYPEKMFNDKLKLIGAELQGDDVLTRNMRKAHELYSRHVSTLRKGKQNELTKEFLIRDILPGNLREGLKGAAK